MCITQVYGHDDHQSYPVHEKENVKCVVERAGGRTNVRGRQNGE